MKAKPQKPNARWVSRYSLDYIDKKLMTSLNRFVDSLMDKSWAKTLEKNDVDSLLNCAKFIKNVIKEEKQMVKNAGELELEKAAASKGATGG